MLPTGTDLLGTYVYATRMAEDLRSGPASEGRGTSMFFSNSVRRGEPNDLKTLLAAIEKRRGSYAKMHTS